MSAMVGFIAALGLLTWAMATGGSPLAFLNVPALVLVLGGVLCLVLARHGFRVFGQHLVMPFELALQRRVTPRQLAQLLAQWSAVGRRDGMLALEQEVAAVSDKRLQAGLLALVNGADEARLQASLRRLGEQRLQVLDQAAAAWRTWVDVAPALGMTGTLIGLIQMLRAMEDPLAVGPAMALALTTTLYGVITANYIAAPVHSRLQQAADAESRHIEDIALGLQLVLRGSGPLAIEEALGLQAEHDHRPL